ncbi:LCP family protein [Bounagaea algeriensis]
MQDGPRRPGDPHGQAGPHGQGNPQRPPGRSARPAGEQRGNAAPRGGNAPPPAGGRPAGRPQNRPAGQRGGEHPPPPAGKQPGAKQPGAKQPGGKQPRPPRQRPPQEGPPRERRPDAARSEEPGRRRQAAHGGAPPEDTWQRSRRSGKGRRQWRYAGRTIAAVMSIVILTTTGFAWAHFRSFTGSTTGGNVLGAGFNSPDGSTDILLTGNDSRTDSEGNPLPPEVLEKLRTTDDEGGDLMDTIMLVRIPNNGERAVVMSFPRDTLIDQGQFGEDKINSTLANAKAAKADELRQQGVTDPKRIERESTLAGQRFLVKTISELTGVSIDNYAEVNLFGFYEVTKAVGGVQVCLNNPVDDPYSGAHFQAGRQKIQGSDALAFVRQRHGLTNELDRGVRQQVFMSSLANKILSSGTLANPAKLSKLIDAVQKSVVLDDQLASDVLGFAQKLRGIDPNKIEFHTAPVRMVGESGSEDVEINPSEMQQFAKDMMLPPEQREQQRAEREQQQQANADVEVSVYNAAGIDGLAGDVSNTLEQAGYTVNGTTNSESMDSSVIYVAPGEEQTGQRMSEQLGGIDVQVSENLSPGSTEVYLASDYSGPGASGIGDAGTVQLDGQQDGPAAQQGGPAGQQPMTNESDSPGQKIDAGNIPCVD